MSLIVDVPKNRVPELTQWFIDQGVAEEDVVKQSGWMAFKNFYRMEFYPGESKLFMLFKMTFV